MSDRGFSSYNDETLLAVRDNLLNGLSAVHRSLLNKTFNTPGTKGAAPPSQSGQLTLALLIGVQLELDERGYPLTYSDGRSILTP